MRASLFGQYLLEQNVIDAEHLGEALKYQKTRNRVLGKLAVENGLLTQEGVLRIIERQWEDDKDFGALAVEMGLLSRESLDFLLRRQKDEHIPLGQALVILGVLMPAQLEEELKVFESIRSEIGDEEDKGGGRFKENPPLCFFNLISRVLSRLTCGQFITGGFYPTIAEPAVQRAFTQRVRGEVNFEVVLLVPDDMVTAMGKSVMNGNMSKSPGKAQRNYETAVKNILGLTVRHFVRQQAREGLSFDPVDRPLKIGLETYGRKRKKAREVHCVEILLISPPGPQGDLLQFHMCLLLDKIPGENGSDC
jgi:hypothetical protein